MAGNVYSVVTASQAASAAETMWQLLAPSDADVKLIEFGISFDGVTASAVPVDVDLLRQSTAGTASGATEVEWRTTGPAARVAATTVFTAEPTAADILASWQVTPNGGLLVVQYPLGREPVIVASERLALRVTPAAAVNITAYAVWEE
jgi:hypothetical protein